MKNLFIKIISLVVFFQSAIELHAQIVEPGTAYFGKNEYTEYTAGNLPIIISVPHGGYLMPSSIPDRVCGDCETISDAFTMELAYVLAEAIHEKTGCYIHLVINKLHRKKLDANRDLPEAALGNPEATEAWYDFHSFIDASKSYVNEHFGKGFYIDLHGHGHSKQRLELGYLLYGSELRKSDALINTAEYINYSSIRNLAMDNRMNIKHAELIRGDFSLGNLLSVNAYPAVPSKSDPYPLANEDYFTGGYNVTRHSSNMGGKIDGVQIECNQAVRFDESERKKFAKQLAESIIAFISLHYFKDFDKYSCSSASAEVTDFYTLYPNPAVDIIRLSGDSSGKISLEVLDYLGKLKIKQDHKEIDVSNLMSGLYYLRMIHSNGKTEGKTFIKW